MTPGAVLSEVAKLLLGPGHLLVVQGLLAEAAEKGEVRADVPPSELTSYCLHALGAAGTMRSKAAVHRLIAVTLSGLRADRPAGAGRVVGSTAERSP